MRTCARSPERRHTPASTSAARRQQVRKPDVTEQLGPHAPQGKVVVAAFTDSLNNLVAAVKQYKAQNVKGGLGAGGQLKVN